MKETDFLMPKGKSNAYMKREVNSGRFPPSVCYKILYSIPEEKRVTPGFLKVDLLGADVPVTFSCRFKEAESKCPGLCAVWCVCVCVCVVCVCVCVRAHIA